MYARWVLTALLVWPAVAAVAILIAPPRWAKHLGFVASLIEFAIAVPLWWTFVPSGGMQFVCDAPWIQVPLFGTGAPWSIHYTVGVDGISLFMVLLTTLLVPLSVLGSYSYITTRERAYYALLLVLTSGMIGVFVALDLFLFYVMWEVMLIPMYFIIGVWGGDSRLYAAIKFFIYTMFGSLLMLVAILALVYLAGQRTGIFSFDYFHLMRNLGDLGPLAFWLFAAFFLAFAIKVPMFPFHTWLPDAHVEAPTAGSVILAGVLLKLGGYGFIRFSLALYPDASHTYAPLIIVLSLIAIIYGAIVAMVQPDLKKLLAAAYLLWMFQRVVLNEPSEFLLGLKHHLTDMTATEILTLAPLGALVVVFGLFPGILLDLFRAPVTDTLAAVRSGSAITIDP